MCVCEFVCASVHACALCVAPAHNDLMQYIFSRGVCVGFIGFRVRVFMRIRV